MLIANTSGFPLNFPSIPKLEKESLEEEEVIEENIEVEECSEVLFPHSPLLPPSTGNTDKVNIFTAGKLNQEIQDHSSQFFTALNNDNLVFEPQNNVHRR